MSLVEQSEVPRLSSSEPSRSQDSRDLQALTRDLEVIATRQSSDSTTRPSSNNPRGTYVLGSDRNNEYLFSPENESPRMQASPAGSWKGSTNHDRTPTLPPTTAPERAQALQSSEQHSPPFRQDSAYESIEGMQGLESTVDVDVQAQNIRARQRVEILRGRVFETRCIKRDSLHDVQLLREKWYDATDKLMRALDEFLVVPEASSLETLKSLRQAVQAAKDRLGPAEDSHILLEMRLNGQEQELEQEEVYFYKHNNISLSIPPDLDLNKPLTPRIKPHEPHADFPKLEDENELVSQYHAKVREAEQLKDKIDFLENEKYRLTQELAFRARHNLKLSEEKYAFLSSFPQEYHNILDALRNAEDELFDLRDRCIDQQLFTENDYPYEPRDALVDEIDDVLNEALDRNPLHIAAMNSSDNPQEVDYANKREYVNTWLLEWVQDSPIEAFRLRSFIFLEYEGELGEEEWPECALDFWFRDDAGVFAMKHHILSTMDVLGSQGPSTWSSSDVNFGESGLGLDYAVMIEKELYPAKGAKTESVGVSEHQNSGTTPKIRRSETLTRASSV